PRSLACSSRGSPADGRPASASLPAIVVLCPRATSAGLARVTIAGIDPPAPRPPRATVAPAPAGRSAASAAASEAARAVLNGSSRGQSYAAPRARERPARRLVWRQRADRAVRDRALLRALGVPRGADALEQRLRVAVGLAAAGARAGQPRAPARAAPRLHGGAGLPRAAHRRGGALRACRARARARAGGRRGGHLRLLPRAAGSGRSRGSGGALLRLGARGGAQHGRRRRAVAAPARRRVGVRDERARGP